MLRSFIVHVMLIANERWAKREAKKMVRWDKRTAKANGWKLSEMPQTEWAVRGE